MYNQLLGQLGVVIPLSLGKMSIHQATRRRRVRDLSASVGVWLTATKTGDHRLPACRYM